MALGRRLINTGAAVAACTTDSADIFGDSSGVLLYSFDYDASDASGTSDGTPSNVTFGVGGQINYGARFNGSSSFINTNYTLTTDTTFSFSWWMNVEAPSSGNNHYIVNDGDGINHDGSFGIYHNASGQLGVFTDDNGGGAVQGGTLSITGGCSGSWMHFVVSVNDTTATIYKNGSSQGTITVGSHTTAGVLTLIIGRLGHYSANHLNGDLDQFRYFSKAISSDEVSLLYAETACVYTATTTDNDYPTTNTAYYKLDNSAEDEKGSYDGTESNIEYRFGRYGQAAVFNGSSSIITATQPSGLNGSCTYSAWLKTTSSSYQSIITVGSVTGSHTAGVNLFVNSGKLSCQTGNGSSTENSTVNSTSDIDTGNWVHCAVVVAGSAQGSSIKVYVNGQEEGSGTADNTAIVAASSESLCLGGRILSGSQSTFLNGSLDQVRIFTSALSSDQITQLYNEKPETDTSNFKTVLYEGNGGTNFVSNVGFEPDLVWVKARDDAHDHVLYDIVRGVGSGKAINSNANYAEGAYDAAYGFLDTFESTGFVAKTGSSFANYTNKNNESYVAWCWKAGGDAVSNTVGDITSTVSANQDAGFSIVKYTPSGGGSVYTNTVGHGLTSAPEIIIQKATGIVVDWYVHTDLIDGSNDYLELNTSDPKADNPHNFAITSTTFTDWGWNGNEVINYCFHSVSGVSKMGKYTGATSGVTENIGFEPSMVIIKNATQSDPWGIFDNKRPSGTGNRSYLYPSTADDEDVYGGSLSGITLTSTGFAIDNTNSHMVNQNGETYLYMAFA